MTLTELFSAVKEPHLTKNQLENYHATLSSLYADMQIEIADIKKAEAMFFLERTNPETADVKIKRLWRGTDQGQRLIELDAYVKGTAKLLSSLKSRLYSVY